MRWPIWCVVGLVLACGKTERRTTANGSGAASVATSFSSAHESAKDAALPQPALKLACSELAPDVPRADEAPGPGVPRITPAASAGLPPASIAYEAEGEIWLVSSSNGRRQKLARGKGARWLPGGRALLFVAELGDHLPRLVEVSVDCRSARTLTLPLFVGDVDGSVPANAYESETFSYSVSPDGRQLAFTRRERGRDDLYVLELSTGTERKLAQGVDLAEPAWFPDGRAVAYLAGDSLESELMSVELASGQTQKHASLRRGSVSVTPDSRLVFYSAVGSSNTLEDRQSRVYQTALGRGAAFSLEGSELAPGAYGKLGVSPDGTKLAAAWALWTGNGPAAVRDHGLALFALPRTLPPAGTRPADLLAAPRPGVVDAKATTIVFTQPKTRNLSRAASGERYSAHEPSWAPDSRHLVFTLAYCGREFAECRSQIVAVDTAAANSPLVFLANGSQPVWAP